MERAAWSSSKEQNSEASLLDFFFFFLATLCPACGILVPWPGIEPVPPAVKAWSLNHWTAREVPVYLVLNPGSVSF